MTTQLILYNKALTEFLGERRLASLSENREPRRVLDDIWDGGVVNTCLEQADWKFAQRTSSLAYDPAITPSFGYRYAFQKPTDLVRLSRIATDEYLENPLLSYLDEAGIWLSNETTIYISYVSSDVAYGKDYTRWPESFAQYVAAFMALRGISRIGQNKNDKDALEKEVKKLLADAKSKDALAGPTRFMPQGSWVSARTRAAGGDRGNRGALIG